MNRKFRRGLEVRIRRGNASELDQGIFDMLKAKGWILGNGFKDMIASLREMPRNLTSAEKNAAKRTRRARRA